MIKKYKEIMYSINVLRVSYSNLHIAYWKALDFTSKLIPGKKEKSSQFNPSSLLIFIIILQMKLQFM